MLEMWKMWVWSLPWEDPLEKEMAAHSSVLVWNLYGQRGLAGCSPCSCKQSDTTERLSTHTRACMHTHAHMQTCTHACTHTCTRAHTCVHTLAHKLSLKPSFFLKYASPLPSYLPVKLICTSPILFSGCQKPLQLSLNSLNSTRMNKNVVQFFISSYSWTTSEPN